MPRSAVDTFRDFLEQHGKRMTRDRQMVAQTVLGLSPPIHADRVFELLRQSVTRPTVYRTLFELKEAGLVRSQLYDGQNVLIHNFGLLSVCPVDEPEPEALCAKTHRTMIAGTCPWCGCLIVHGRKVWS